MPTRPRLLVACLLCAATGRLAGQSEASVGLGAGTVRAPGSSALGVFLLTPSLRLANPQRVLSFGTTFAVLPGGRPYTQGSVGAWIASPALAGHWRAAFTADATGASLHRGGSNGSGQLGAEVVGFGRGWGTALGGGAAVGVISGSAPVTAWHATWRGWWQDGPGRTLLTAEVEPTRFLGAWFTDLQSTWSWRLGRLDASLWAAARVSTAFGSRGAGTASAEWRMSKVVSLEGALGRVLPDPYQGLPATTFASAGLRVRLPQFSRGRQVIIHTRTLEVMPRRTGQTLRFRQDGAATVSIAGDWNDWVPQLLTALGPGRWEVTLHLSPGVYHFRLLIDGVPWSIPPGVPVVEDDFGDRVAVLTVN